MREDFEKQPGHQGIRIAGFGGQGVILAGFILGKAAALFDRRAAVMTQSYGPESRGGACSADVVLGAGEIDYPCVRAPHVLLALSQQAYATHVPMLREDGLLMIDADLVQTGAATTAVTHAIPATRLAEELGKKMAANMILLGFFTARTLLVSEQAMRRAIQNSVPAQSLALNLRAFALGLNYTSGQAIA